MIPETPFSRRALMVRGIKLAGLCGLGMLPAGTALAQDKTVCAKPGIGDQEHRDALHYAEETKDAQRRCDLCMYFQARGGCGNCRVLESSVSPAGTCDSFSLKGRE